MALNSAAWILSNAYTKATASEFGAVKGASCQIGSVSFDSEGNTLVEFLWENTSGVQQKTTAVIKRGATGASVAGGHFNDNGELVIELDNGTELEPITLPAAKVELSKKEGNYAKMEKDGLYVPTPEEAAISEKENNALTKEDDGLYVPKTEDVNISKEEGNIFEKKDDGYYVKAQEQSDFGQVDSTKSDYIKNKPFETVGDDFEVPTDGEKKGKLSLSSAIKKILSFLSATTDKYILSYNADKGEWEGTKPPIKSWSGTVEDWTNDTGSIPKDELVDGDIVNITDDDDTPTFVNKDQFDISSGILNLSTDVTEKLAHIDEVEEDVNYAYEHGFISKNICNVSNAKNLTDLVSSVDDDGTIHIKVAPIASYRFFAYMDVEKDKHYMISATELNHVRLSLTNGTAYADTVLDDGTKDVVMSPTRLVNGFVPNYTGRIYFTLINDMGTRTEFSFKLKVEEGYEVTPYTQYAMSNKQLTEEIAHLYNVLWSADLSSMASNTEVTLNDSYKKYDYLLVFAIVDTAGKRTASPCMILPNICEKITMSFYTGSVMYQRNGEITSDNKFNFSYASHTDKLIPRAIIGINKH